MLWVVSPRCTNVQLQQLGFADLSDAYSDIVDVCRHLDILAGYFAHPRLCSAPIFMVKSAQHRDRHDGPVGIGIRRGTVGHVLSDALMRPSAVAVTAMALQDRGERPRAEDNHVIEALGAHAAQEALTHAVGVRRSHWCAQDPNPGRLRQRVEAAAEFVIVIADQEARSFTPCGGFAELLCDPRAGGGAGRGTVHDASGAKLDDHRGVSRARRTRNARSARRSDGRLI